MGQTKVYNADQVKVSVCGIPIEGGHADGEFLRVVRASDAFGDKIGTTGEVVRHKTNDKRADVTLILLQTAQSNDALSALANVDEFAEGGAGVGQFIARDLNGRTVISGLCWIARQPDGSWDREATSREWKIRVADLNQFHGGSAAVGG